MPISPCTLCASTGKTLTRLSFPTEGFVSSRCYVCKGTGETKTQASDHAVQEQVRMRNLAKRAAKEAA